MFPCSRTSGDGECKRYNAAVRHKRDGRDRLGFKALQKYEDQAFYQQMVLSLALKRLLLGIVAGMVVAPGASPQSHGSKTTSGIEGVVRRSPLCGGPVKKDRPCADEPYKTTLVVKRVSDQRSVAKVESDDNGRFHIALPPGKYVIVNDPAAGLYPRIYTEEIVVSPRRFTSVEVHADTGMR